MSTRAGSDDDIGREEPAGTLAALTWILGIVLSAALPVVLAFRAFQTGGADGAAYDTAISLAFFGGIANVILYAGAALVLRSRNRSLRGSAWAVLARTLVLAVVCSVIVG
ncbi:hypothetical protein N8K70_05035 [Microbacterium betulae]|uniref:Uncharacterized protein n=1 Tax=Microbacterium betulae TaxID=2981139 RepID=A0AA97I5R8_9MICO|nr:hypothetical protein [Microbacterium sp. AB]WOF24046.1 hypothetical protein N8K70_05035 [Microbacterium sp. AB]